MNSYEDCRLLCVLDRQYEVPSKIASLHHMLGVSSLPACLPLLCFIYATSIQISTHIHLPACSIHSGSGPKPFHLPIVASSLLP
eukprot:c26824_g1_i1 orf=135-386(+)